MKYKPDPTNVQYYDSVENAISSEIDNLRWWLKEYSRDFDSEELESCELLEQEMLRALRRAYDKSNESKQ